MTAKPGTNCAGLQIGFEKNAVRSIQQTRQPPWSKTSLQATTCRCQNWAELSVFLYLAKVVNLKCTLATAETARIIISHSLAYSCCRSRRIRPGKRSNAHVHLLWMSCLQTSP